MMRQSRKKRTFIIYGTVVFIFSTALILCLSMVNTINKRMNESAASNLLNTTLVIQDTLESFLDKDLDSLNIIGDFHKNGLHLEREQINMLCDAMGFDWIGIVDSLGNGTDYFTNKLTLDDLPFYSQWNPEETGYSDVYIGESGRSEIALWVPIYKDGQYIGTVFGGIILTKYYSANVFTFYDGEGRTYLFDGADGTWILKSLGTDGVSTHQLDIYSLLSYSGNEEQDIKAFKQAVEERKAGTAEFNFNGEGSYLCFLPLSSSPNWYVTTVISKDALLSESSEVQRMIQWVLVVLCVSIASAAAGFAVWRVRKTKTEEARYRETLFANISANLDSAFLIYEKSTMKTAFVSDNIKRLLGLNREWLSEDASHLFDWCGISENDPMRTDFLKGAMKKPEIREVNVENELGENTRTIRLELIPADMDQELAVMTDITKDKDIQSSLVEAMERAEEASRAKNDFLSAMSHDLRTPINGVVGMTTIAATHLDDKNRVRDCLKKINESTSHLLSLINEVLDMSQLESGKIQLINEPFNIAELLQNVLNANYPGIQQKNHTVKVNLHVMDHEEVIGDPVRLTRITENLISNAIKYTPSGGNITLTLQEKTENINGYGCYELTVQDNGIGISDQFQEKLFEPFEREEDVRISRIQGTGLGMSIVKNIVDLMMGSIQVESKKGRGTTFRVMVNLKLNDQKKKNYAILSDQPVLVISSDIETCNTVSEMLCNIGMRGEWADSVERAVSMAAEHSRNGEDYRAVLMDWRIQGIDGAEMVRRIRTEMDKQISIIILTAHEGGTIEEEAIEAGVEGFISKPVYKAKLLQKMTEIIGGHTGNSDMPNHISVRDIPKGKRVLLAEDNDLNKEIAVEFLRMIGVETDSTDNGEEVVERFANSEPGTYDMILMDIQMPKMNGYEATRMIRSMERPDSQTIPIVAMTADAFKKDEQAAHEAGMNEHLAKPISVERLTQVVRKYLKKDKTERC